LPGQSKCKGDKTPKQWALLSIVTVCIIAPYKYSYSLTYLQIIYTQQPKYTKMYVRNVMLSYQCFRELSEWVTSDPVNPYKEQYTDTNTLILISMIIKMKAIVAA